MSEVTDLKFETKVSDEQPAEKQPYYILTWVSNIITYLQHHKNLEDATQTFLVTELNQLLTYIEKSKQLPALLSKSIRLEIGKAYQGIYSGTNRRLLFETVSFLIKFISASKADKYSDFKQYVFQFINNVDFILII